MADKNVKERQALYDRMLESASGRYDPSKLSYSDDPMEVDPKAFTQFGKEAGKLGITDEQFQSAYGKADRETIRRKKEEEERQKDREWVEKRQGPGLARPAGGKEKHTRRKKLRQAIMLRKKGFTRAAEQAAADWARSPEASAPSIATPAYMAEREQVAADAKKARDVNRRLMDRLIANPIPDAAEKPKWWKALFGKKN
jgi:hypothetical protein